MSCLRHGLRFCILFAGCCALVGCDTPIGSQANEAIAPYVSWTPEAIEKDPKGYLRHVIAECERTKSDIEARRIVLRKEKSKLQSELAAAQSGVQRLEEQLASYKEAYRSADESGSWPASANGLKLSESELRKVVMDKHRETEEARTALTSNPEKIARIDNRLADLDLKENQVDDAKVKASEKLEKVAEGEVYASVEEIEIALSDLDAASDAVGEGAPEITLSDVEGAADPKQAEFDAIMAD